MFQTNKGVVPYNIMGTSTDTLNNFPFAKWGHHAESLRSEG